MKSLSVRDGVSLEERTSTIGGSKKNTARWRGLLLIICGVLILLAFGIFSSPYLLSIGTTAVIFGIVALSQEWIMGRAGIVSFGGAAFLGIGAFLGAELEKLGVDQIIFLIIAGLIAGFVLGCIVGIVSLRFETLYVLLATIAFQFIVAYVLEVVEGNSPINFIYARLATINVTGSHAIYYTDAIILICVMMFLRGCLSRYPGRIWRSIREHAVASSAFGIDVRRWRVMAFAGSSSLATMAGVLYGISLGTVDYNDFSLTTALSIVVMVYLGGVDSLLGPLMGAVVVVGLPFLLNDLSGSLGGPQGWLAINSPTVALLVEWILLTLVLIAGGRGIMGLILKYKGKLLARFGFHSTSGYIDPIAQNETLKTLGK